MDLTNLATLRQILDFYNLSAQKKLGQNFLVNRSVLDDIIQASELKTSDLVIEIGPGLGTLTRELSAHAGRVVAIEKDLQLLRVAKAINRDLANTKFIEKNVLGLNRDFLLEEIYDWLGTNKGRSKTINGAVMPYVIVANLPYYITSAILRHFLESDYRPEKMIIMVQKEVAERIVALDGKESLLSISVKFFARPMLVSVVSKKSFMPVPQVDSAILRIDSFSELPWGEVDETVVFRLVRIGFAEKRKQLKNTLAHGLRVSEEECAKWLSHNRISPTRRAETLSVKEWVRLATNLDMLYG